ncbi:DUF4815 domain-containing protein [Acidovorax sp. PRC11]|uniref:DUF4815 domain-containing protein n=1 Tax=Acidovorax sp. PRC11 TaxID=2962592 RepID=UPI002882C96C|nr:DUF4815 domain-containing protein [Acidovorax sp. PRC11]MDT0137282.1 DUF4815 domain-containing protein [Acidovorax sp. PRC11]
MTIYNYFDETKNHDSVLFEADRVIQSRELIDAQEILAHRIKGIADGIYANGDVVRDARLTVNPQTGQAVAESGAIYLQGAVRGVPPASFVIPVQGNVAVGVYLRTRIVTAAEDPSLLNPAKGTPSYKKPGAARREVSTAWGFQGDGQAGTFFGVYVVEDGVLRAKAAPPHLSAITRAIEDYDVASTGGGSYIVEGLQVAMAPDLPTGEQVYTVAEGAARVAGRSRIFQAGRRLVTLATPELFAVDSEPHLSTTEGPQRIDIGRPPCKGVPEFRITARRTVTIVHGGFAGVADVLPDASVISIEAVKQGGTNFAKDADYRLTAGQVDWSPQGAEPAPGSSYQVTYLYIKRAEATAADPRGATVEGAIKDSTILVSYQQQLRRVDRLCINREGAFEWLRGVSSAWTPTPPQVPDDMLALASVFQTWDGARQVVSDGVKIQSPHRIALQEQRMDAVMIDLAELRLATSAQGMDSGIKKGLIADPFLTDRQRDAGIAQTAAAVNGALQLPITTTVHQLGTALPERVAIEHTHRVVLEQTWRTGSRLVNPYMAFDPVPAAIALAPNVDRWTTVDKTWQSAITERFYTGAGSESTLTATATAVRTLSEESRPIEYLRSIAVRFDISGWGPGEGLQSITFDGIAVAAQPIEGGTLKGDAAGKLSGTFTVPEKVTAGAKAVVFRGPLGSRGSQTFYGQGTNILRSQQNVVTESYSRWNKPVPQAEASSGGGAVWGPGPSIPVYTPISTGGGAVWGPASSGTTAPQNTSACARWLYDGYFDPSAQSFVLDEDTQCSGVRLLFTAAGGPVTVQIREAAAGVPTPAVVAEARVPLAGIQIDAPTTITWTPALLLAGREYCIVTLCDEAQTAIAVAELGKQDPQRGYVVAQPYQVGVFSTSSNNSAWTVHQDVDQWFQLLAASYTASERVIDLGTADVVGMTDLMVLGFAERPSAASGVVFEVQFPEAMKSEVVRLNDGQIVWLAAPFTGRLKVRARITGDTRLAAVLQNGVQLIAGHIEESATYVSRTVNATGASRLRVVYEGDIPGGAAVQVHAQAAYDGAPWVLVPYLSASANTRGVREITCELTGLQAAAVRVRLTLTGSTTARPYVRNLRGATL